MTLKDFQLTAVKSLFEAMDKPARDIILKSPTGSGKTIILTYFMHQYIQSFSKTVFVWLTPGKGNLEEQSKAKMDKYIHASQTKLLSDVMTAGFEENDSCFINWEKLTKKGNNALKDSERTNFLEHIQNALNNGLHFVIMSPLRIPLAYSSQFAYPQTEQLIPGRQFLISLNLSSNSILSAYTFHLSKGEWKS